MAYGLNNKQEWMALHTSTKEYIKHRILQLMDQCDISIHDVQKAVDEIKRPPGTLGYHDVEEYYKD